MCLGFLTCITVLMYLLFSSATNCENVYVEKLFKNNKIEDGQFFTLMPISDDIEELEKEYDLSIEQQDFFDAEEDNYSVRLFTFTEKINKVEVTEGSAPTNNNEICLSQSFAEASKYDIGDSITLDGFEYTVVGYALRPDYLYEIKNQSDSFHRAEEFGLGFVTTERMEEIEDSQYYYSVIYNKDNCDEFRKYLNDEYVTLSYMTSETNHRISTPKSTVEQYQIITGVILPVLLILVIAVITVVLGRKVRSEKKYIGTLTALGYRKLEIAMHYTWYALIPGIIGEVLGLVLAYCFVEEMANAFFFKLEKIPADYRISGDIIIPAMLFPILCYVITAIFTSLRILRMNVTDMLSGRSNNGRETKLLVKSNINFKSKFRVRALLNYLSRTLVAILGILVGGLIMSFGLMMKDSCVNYEDKVIDDIGTFKYEYILNYVTNQDDIDGEKALSSTFEVENSEISVMLMGLSDDVKYVNTTLLDGGKADLQGKYYISSMAATVFDKYEGDTLTVIDSTTLEKYDIKISGVINNRAQFAIYSDRKTVATLLNIDEDMYNVVMSDSALDIDEDILNSTIEKQTMKDMIQNVISGMNGIIYLMVVFGAVICVVCVYLMVNMLIEENTVTISMLKVLGYFDREINKITVNVYHILVPVGIILSLVGGYYLAHYYFEYSTASFQAQIPAFISVKGLIIFVIGIVGAYLISLSILMRKVKNVNMSDSLKSIRE